MGSDIEEPNNSPQNTHVVYIAASSWAQRNRLASLTSLAGQNVQVIFISNRPLNVGSARNVVIKPAYNPFGLLRMLGLRRFADTLDKLAYFPSRARLYRPRVTRYLRKAIRLDLAAGRRVTLLTPAPPLDMPIVGLQLKREMPSIWWANDWNDLWTYDASYLRRTHRFYHARARRLENQLFRMADMNVTTNAHAREYIIGQAALREDQVMAIPHHIHPDDEQAAGTTRTTRTTTTQQEPTDTRLVFMGGMFKPPKVRGDKFLDALAQLRKEGVDAKLHLYSTRKTLPARYEESKDEFGLVVESPIPTTDAVATLGEYDYLLLLLEDLPNSKVIMHLKLPEYLIAGPPVIAVVPAGSAAESIITDTQTGYVLDSGSNWIEGLRCILSGEAQPVTRNEKEVETYLWRSVRLKWLDALNLQPR